MDLKVWHSGSCHCEAVKFRVLAAADLDVYKCNCSVCWMKQNHHFIVPKRDFELVQGEDNLTTYTFNTGAAKHQFCRTCGVQAFYQPRSNPDGVAVTVYCIKMDTVKSVNYITYDGKNWESAFEAANISERSK